MPEQDRERLKGQITETHSSDSYIERQLGEIRSELEGIGADETVTGDILEPRLIDGGLTIEHAEQKSKISRFDPQRHSHDSSALADYYQRIRVKAQKARLKKVA